jgi:hypothetical protein
MAAAGQRPDPRLSSSGMLLVVAVALLDRKGQVLLAQVCSSSAPAPQMPLPRIGRPPRGDLSR